MKILSAKTVAPVFMMLAPVVVKAQWAVIDPTNLIQNTVSAVEEVAQTAKQIQEYKTQLQQYENMLQNTMAPSAYIWDQAQTTMNQLRRASDTLSYYKNTAGGIGGYLDRYKNVNTYRSNPCFQLQGCNKQAREKIKEDETTGNEARKKANDALMESLDQQQDALERDSAQLERLQASAQGADGQMAALGYANQLASNQTNQLMQIRSLLLAQQNALSAKMQADASRESREKAAHEMVFTPGEPTNRGVSKEY